MPLSRRVLSVSCLTIMAWMLAGCADGPWTRPNASDYPRKPSHAVPQDQATALGRLIQPLAKQHPGQSGFHVLETGHESLAVRLALIREAERTIDLQYFTINNDVSSNLFLEAILRAAARGVRVRFLIDHVSMKSVGDSLAVLDGVQNIDIRVFNPTVTRDQATMARLAGPITDVNQALRRMHNKAFIVDNQVSILGGRNLGDEYFDDAPDTNFKDLDMLAAGPVTAHLSHSFDMYWNSDNAFPMALVKRVRTQSANLARIKTGLRDNWDGRAATAEGKRILSADFSDRVRTGQTHLIWAEATLAADHPDKVDNTSLAADSKPLHHLLQLTDKANREFILISPYFVPRDSGVNWLTGMVHDGIAVKVLTNSLAATDVVAVHSGYQDYRLDLITGGVDLYELKPTDGKRAEQRVTATTAPPYASLHAKLYIIDRRAIMIGSFNFDPRSIALNTEVALVVHSPEIAEQLFRIFHDTIRPQNSYHVMANPDRQLEWHTVENGKNVFYRTEPNAGIGRRLQAFLMSLLPLENHL